MVIYGGVRSESWRVERRDSVERIASDYNIIGRCGVRAREAVEREGGGEGERERVCVRVGVVC